MRYFILLLPPTISLFINDLNLWHHFCTSIAMMLNNLMKEEDMSRFCLSISFLVIWLLVSLASAADLADEMKVIKVKEKVKYSLGILITEVEKNQLEKYQLKGGARIMEVLEDSEAERIGLQKDDIIIRFAGQEISNPSQIKSILNEMLEEGMVEIVIMREGERKTFQAKLVPKKAEDLSVDVELDSLDFSGLADLPMKIMKKMSFGSKKGGFLGVHAKNLNEQLREYFQVENGVLVEEIVKDSPAEKAGLKAGDVIMEIEKRRIQDYEDLVRTVNYYDPDETVSLKYSRKGKVSSVSIKLDKKTIHKHNFGMGPHGEEFLHIEPPLPPDLPDMEHQLEKLKELKSKQIKVDLKLYLI
jgi:C-terminal processing protease CtpA/Prc